MKKKTEKVEEKETPAVNDSGKGLRFALAAEALRFVLEKTEADFVNGRTPRHPDWRKDVARECFKIADAMIEVGEDADRV